VIDDRRAGAGGERPIGIPGDRPVGRFRSTAAGGVLAAGLLGLRDALEGPVDEDVAIVEAYSGDPPGRERIILRLDPDEPSDSIVLVRDWMSR
jgi:hypothetical protein